MKRILTLITVATLTSACSTASAPQLPLAPGQYVFQHRFAEHPELPSVALVVTISDSRIVVVNPTASGPFPAGILSEGRLLWHASSRQWIIGQDAADLQARDVGGCSDGPEVVDLEQRIYWTC